MGALRPESEAILIGVDASFFPLREAARVDKAFAHLNESINAEECVENIAACCRLPREEFKNFAFAEKRREREMLMRQAEPFLQL